MVLSGKKRWGWCDCDRCQRDVSAAEANLQQVLLAMRKRLRLPRLEYVSIQNQADFLIEVPVEMTDVPKVCPISLFGIHCHSDDSKVPSAGWQTCKVSSLVLTVPSHAPSLIH